MAQESMFFIFGKATLRISEISHWYRESGHSFSKLVIVMKTGDRFEERDHLGSNSKTEAVLLKAIEGAN